MFRVASYNVHSCIGIDRHFAPERVAEAIEDMGADVVAVQELGWHHRGRRNFDQFAFIEQRTGYRVLQGPTKFHARAHYGNAILTKKNVRHFRTVDLSWPMHIPRGCIMAEVELGGRHVMIVNVHLGLSPWERRRQARVLLAELDKIQDEIVLMGDLNIWQPNSIALRSLAQRLPTYTDCNTFHTRSPRAALDRIFLSAGLSFEEVSVWRTPVTAKASDHLPIVADVVAAEHASEAAPVQGVCRTGRG